MSPNSHGITYTVRPIEHVDRVRCASSGYNICPRKVLAQFMITSEFHLKLASTNEDCRMRNAPSLVIK